MSFLLLPSVEIPANVPDFFFMDISSLTAGDRYTPDTTDVYREQSTQSGI